MFKWESNTTMTTPRPLRGQLTHTVAVFISFSDQQVFEDTASRYYLPYIYPKSSEWLINIPFAFLWQATYKYI